MRSLHTRLAGLALTAGLAAGMLPATVLAADAPVPVDAPITVSGAPVGGEGFTFAVDYPDGFEVPADAVCQWELRVGDDQSLLHNEYDDTFASFLVRGRADQGDYCVHWTMTLPYSASGQWQFDFSAVTPDGDPLIVHPVDGYSIMSGTNAPGALHGIASSNIPGVYLSMSAKATGQPVTVTAHPFGGYVQPTDGARWAAFAPGDDVETHVAENRSMTFTFTPVTPGSWSVFYNDNGGSLRFAGAGVDPTIKAAPKAGPKVTATMARLVKARRYVPFSIKATGFSGSVSCSLAVGGKRILTGCKGRLLFTSPGNRRVTVTVRDAKGHVGTQTFTVRVHR